MSVLQRRAAGGSRLCRIPSKTQEMKERGMSCPSSPAVKKAFRLVVVGAARTGKSSLVGRFLDANFRSLHTDDRELLQVEWQAFSYRRNTEFQKLYKIKSEVYQLDIIDCSGNDPFPAARKLSYISGDMFLLVSSVDNADSVAHMLDIKQQISDCKASRGAAGGSDTPCVFALNKADLPEHRWQITEKEVAEQIEHLTGSQDAFVVCSAANNLNIDKTFAKLFALNKCPKHMNPEMHKMLRNELSADGETGRRHILRRMRSRFSREQEEHLTTYTDLNARRPSLRTDLLINRAKTSVIHQRFNFSQPSPKRIRRQESGRCIIM